MSVDWEHSIKSGRLFQSFGAATAKARSALPSSLDLGTVKSSSVDRRGLELEQGQRNAVMHRGGCPCKALKTNRRTIPTEVSPGFDRQPVSIYESK